MQNPVCIQSSDREVQQWDDFYHHDKQLAWKGVTPSVFFSDPSARYYYGVLKRPRVQHTFLLLCQILWKSWFLRQNCFATFTKFPKCPKETLLTYRISLQRNNYRVFWLRNWLIFYSYHICMYGKSSMLSLPWIFIPYFKFVLIFIFL